MKNLLFVDDDVSLLRGLERQLHSMRKEWKTTFVDSGEKALQYLAAAPVDIIVSDMKMAGMDGADLLVQVMERHPDTIRIVLSGQVGREGALRLVGPAHQYLSKPCEAEELRAVMTRALELCDRVANRQIKQSITKLKSLPSLPSLYLRLIDELRNENSSPETVGQIISHDLGMTSKMLQLVNSAFFGMPQKISDPCEAVIYLGTSTVRSLVLSLKVFSLFDDQSFKGFSMKRLFDHSWTTAVVARKIASLEKAGVEIEEECFLAGLLHDVGKLALAAGMPKEYTQILESAQTKNLPTRELESSRFGMTHAEVGGYLLGLWGLPPPIVEAVSRHHQPLNGATNVFSPTVAVRVADLIAHDLLETNLWEQCQAVDWEAVSADGLEERFKIWKQHCSQPPQ